MHHLNRWSGEMREEGRIALDNLVPIVCFWCCTHTNTQTQVRIPQLHPPSEASASHLLCIYGQCARWYEPQVLDVSPIVSMPGSGVWVRRCRSMTIHQCIN